MKKMEMLCKLMNLILPLEKQYEPLLLLSLISIIWLDTVPIGFRGQAKGRKRQSSPNFFDQPYILDPKYMMGWGVVRGVEIWIFSY